MKLRFLDHPPLKLRRKARPLAVLRLTAVLIASSGAGCERYWVCGEVSRSATGALPQRLSETGLYADILTETLSPGVVPYTPRFELWSDGATKRRWIFLPEGQAIDTSDMDDWVFPEGTKIWKEFSLGEARIETRLLEKHGPSDNYWLSLSYVWTSDGADALAAPLGGVDVQDTDHDVPAAGECQACHGGRRSFVLGFSAVQLSARASAGGVDLDTLVREGRLSHPPANIPVLPGDPVEVAALGYLHANCSHCHNQSRPERSGPRCFDPKSDADFTLAVGELDEVTSTPTYQTVVGDSVHAGDPGSSKLYELMSSRGMFRQMPPLATERVDTAALANIRRWIEQL